MIFMSLLFFRKKDVFPAQISCGVKPVSPGIRSPRVPIKQESEPIIAINATANGEVKKINVSLNFVKNCPILSFTQLIKTSKSLDNRRFIVSMCGFTQRRKLLIVPFETS